MVAQRSAVYAGLETRELYVNGASPTIALLHGFGQSSECWRLVLDRLEQLGQAAIAVDLLGFGHSAPLGPGMVLPQLDEFVADVVAQHAVGKPVVVVGNSLGGLLAVRAAESFRGLPIRGVLAVDAAGAGWTRTMRLINGPALVLLRLSSLAPLPYAIRHAALAIAGRAALYGDPRAAVDPEPLREFCEPARTRHDFRRHCMLAVRTMTEVNALKALTEIHCPTMVLHGSRDRLVSVSAARRLQQQIPGSRFVLLPGVGHCPQLDAPERVAKLAAELAGHLDRATEGAARHRLEKNSLPIDSSTPATS